MPKLEAQAPLGTHLPPSARLEEEASCGRGPRNLLAHSAMGV